jgi:hypothetical protein
VGFKRQHAALDAPLLGFAVEQRQHRLMTPVHAVKVADRQRAGRCNAGVVETAKDLHEVVIFLIAGRAFT